MSTAWRKRGNDNDQGQSEQEWGWRNGGGTELIVVGESGVMRT
jgi:hypothetical protein